MRSEFAEVGPMNLFDKSRVQATKAGIETMRLWLCATSSKSRRNPSRSADGGMMEYLRSR
jgi:hypothetical protein